MLEQRLRGMVVRISWAILRRYAVPAHDFQQPRDGLARGDVDDSQLREIVGET